MFEHDAFGNHDDDMDFSDLPNEDVYSTQFNAPYFNIITNTNTNDNSNGNTNDNSNGNSNINSNYNKKLQGSTPNNNITTMNGSEA